MKNFAIGILLIAAVVFGGLYIQQTRKTSQTQSTAAGLQRKVSELETSLAQREEETAGVRAALKTARAEALAKASEASHLEQALTNRAQTNAQDIAQSPAQTNKTSNPLAEMFKNPEMREMIKNQQKTVLGTMIDKNYAKLFGDLHLTPEQSASLKDLIMNKTLSAADMGMSMLSEDMDAAKRADLVQQMKTQTDAADAQIKQFLGDDNYAQFQAYEKTQAERMALSGFKDQLAGSSTVLSPDQEQQLIEAMGQERQNFKFTTDYSDQSKLTGDLASYFTEDKINTFIAEQTQLNQQYLTRAQGILSADQYAAFQKFLTGQLEMQKLGMQMATRLFSPKPANN
jgi:hypothetical protein